MLEARKEAFFNVDNDQSILKYQIQPLIGMAIIIILIVYGFFLNNHSTKLSMHLIAGVAMGYVLSRARFGFAGGIKRIAVRGEGSLTKALLVMFGVTMFVTLGIQWLAAQNGAVPAYLATNGQVIIPGTQNVAFANLATIIGGFLFGTGMIFSGGCASGTLSDMGEGEGRSWLTILFFVLFSVPGESARYLLDQTAIGKIGMRLYLPQSCGFFGAFVISALALVFLYYLTMRYERKRQDKGTYLDPNGDWENFEKPISDDSNSVSTMQKIYHKLFIERWSFMTGGLLVALIWLFILVSQNKAWGVTSPFSRMGVYVLNSIGINFSNPKLVEISDHVSNGLMFDGGTIRNIGLVIGALIAFLLAGRFKADFKFTFRNSGFFILGGILMGFGARFAKGCNVGALYSSMSTFSISGWIFLLAMTLGGIFALKFFAGQACTLPKLK